VLHPIKRAKCGKKLQAIVELQHQLLAFACDPACTSAHLTKPEFIKRFGPDKGGWLWARFAIGRPPILETLTTLVMLSSPERQAILAAFEHDICFEEHYDDDTFTFTFRILSPDAQIAVKSFLQKFYDPLLTRSGYPKAVHGDDGVFSRDDLVRAFWNSNPDLGVCPACDGQKPDEADSKVSADVDHFLPKSKYPFLSCHEHNLLPLCISCNRFFKLDTDPIDDHTHMPMLRTFHPYHRPARPSIQLIVGRDNSGGYSLQMAGMTDTDAQPVVNLERLLRLQSRWQKRIKSAIAFVCADLRRARRKMQRCGRAPIRDDLKEELEDIYVSIKEQWGQQVNHYLYAYYVQWAKGDRDEFAELWNEFSGGRAGQASVGALPVIRNCK
jgi:hypothetical protein